MIAVIAPNTVTAALRRGLRPGAGFLLLHGMASTSWAQCQPSWSPIEPPGQSFAFEVHDEDGPGPIPPALYMGDRPDAPLPSRNVNRFDGWSWQSVGPGVWWHEPVSVINVETMLSLPEEVVPGLRGLLVGGLFTMSGPAPISPRIALWDGRQWRNVGPGAAAGNIIAFAVHDEDGDGPAPPALFAGGQLTAVQGDPTTQGIARWDGVRWSSVGGGLHPYAQGATVAAAELVVYDEDGAGGAHPALFAGGYFAYAGALRVYNLAKWDGLQWSRVGGCGVNGDVRALAVYDDGSPGPAGQSLYVGGSFSYVRDDGGLFLDTDCLARWNGREWSAVPDWESGNVMAIHAFDEDGPGPGRPALFIGGQNVRPQNIDHRGICRWDGQDYSMLGSGLGGFSSHADTLGAFDEDGAGPNPGGLYVGGGFTIAGGIRAVGTARWGCPLPPRCEADCDTSTGRGTLDVFDFLCFQNRYEINNPSACDCDLSTGPRACDLFDFLCFQNHFAAGCP